MKLQTINNYSLLAKKPDNSSPPVKTEFVIVGCVFFLFFCPPSKILHKIVSQH